MLVNIDCDLDMLKNPLLGESQLQLSRADGPFAMSVWGLLIGLMYLRGHTLNVSDTVSLVLDPRLKKERKGICVWSSQAVGRLQRGGKDWERKN